MRFRTLPIPQQDPERAADERDLRILALAERGAPLPAIASMEGVTIEHVRQLLREPPE